MENYFLVDIKEEIANSTRSLRNKSNTDSLHLDFRNACVQKHSWTHAARGVKYFLIADVFYVDEPIDLIVETHTNSHRLAGAVGVDVLPHLSTVSEQVKILTLHTQDRRYSIWE